ncbi:zinc finger BED domain-containing protein RICESLEEPER 2-like [Gossypium australe]|uniref:Zinc finger BED domain-containing protein RICESLEEPER 2-like n=1 Tax=Gossypium australe TaxID=47621 RepID=A0A5B6WYL9_9ROSI|nr:zinc finger BED domain-containing protein RICESLEEPER 2-like [Gossypium australe]
MIDKAFTIIVVNASSNDFSMSYLKKKFTHIRTSILRGKYMHVRCITHIVNLVILDGLKGFNESVFHVIGVVRYVRQSPFRNFCLLLENFQTLTIKVFGYYVTSNRILDHISTMYSRLKE